VIRICQILGGLPLGIELAAAWVGLLSCEEIAKEIERNLDFLAVSMHGLPERHHSLRATLDHSWNLLNSEEKVILSRLSVFWGSFSREAAEEICGANLALLSSLINKSLLHRTDHGRFDLHELIHQYAALRLAENAQEEEQFKNQHAFYFAKRLSIWEKALKSSKQAETLVEISQEIDNLRQAWQRLVTYCIFDWRNEALRSPSLFHSSLFSLNLFYEMRCRNREAISLFGHSVEALREAQKMFESPEDKWFLETILGHIIAYLGFQYANIHQYQQACKLLEEAVCLLEHSLARAEKAQAQDMLAWIFLTQGQIQKSLGLLEESLTIVQEEGEDWWYIRTLIFIGWAYLFLGKARESTGFFQEGFRLAEPGDLRLGIPIRTGLARASYLQNDYVAAECLLKESLELSFQLGSKRETALCYLDLGQVALAYDQNELAEMNFQECINLLSEFGESHDIALGLVYYGKSLTARLELEAAREKFLQVIRIGQSLNIFYLVYWGFVNLARILLLERPSRTSFGGGTYPQNYSVEVKVVKDDMVHLMADLRNRLSPDQVDAAFVRMEGRTTVLLNLT
jgi:tetratricopeptide (TPR) repeat protein